MKKTDRESRLLGFWLQRPENQRTMSDVLAFAGWVQQNHAYLLFGMHGDPYQALKSVLRHHIHEPS